MSIVIGIDPGSLHTGYGIVDLRGREWKTLDHGVIDLSPNLSFAQRLANLSERIRQLLNQYQPTDMSVEKIFLGKNADSAFKLGHARGVVLALAAEHGLSIKEYATRHVKKVVTGSGGSDKEQVNFMVERILGQKPASLDASDALALAICFGRELEVENALARQEDASP